MTSTFGDPRESIESLLATVTEQNEKLAEMQRSMADMRGKGEGADGRVKVEVAHNGALVGLTIDPRAMRLGSGQLADEILTAAREAAKDISERAEEMMRPLITELMQGSGRLGDAAAGSSFGGSDVEQVLAALKEARKTMGIE
ncbi:YbaB/EbfC family nucleoid-associated protein [Actinoallomurus soli]|uniref:YbaB/EbfC family nucleoid-associated protein n=1 Tax=Actinoallomurus soli TaxID=2952535 RepID=UPI002092C2D9|nr:YbaB/EbfC family nucleoid-associated protein [Actinoallomurus soli]MCO5968799.1 YbaB/EbfC family nucleoid-associated protein [Actinoallomurus soli]